MTILDQIWKKVSFDLIQEIPEILSYINFLPFKQKKPEHFSFQLLEIPILKSISNQKTLGVLRSNFFLKSKIAPKITKKTPFSTEHHYHFSWLTPSDWENTLVAKATY